MHEVYDPKSSLYRQFLSQRQLADRFGPSQTAYEKVLNYLRTNGLELIQGSANRLTLTVRGDLNEVEQGVRGTDPSLPIRQSSVLR